MKRFEEKKSEHGCHFKTVCPSLPTERPQTHRVIRVMTKQRTNDNEVILGTDEEVVGHGRGISVSQNQDYASHGRTM